MAPHSRFSPVKFYPGGGGSAARRAAPLTGQTMRIDRYKPQEMPPGAGAQTVQALAKVAAAFIEEERDKKDRAAERADQATTVEMMKALRAPQTPFDPAKYGTSPEELRAAAVVMPEGEEDDAWPVPSSEDQREFYTDAAKRTQTAYDQGDPHGADLVIKRHGAGDYNIKDTRDWWDKFIGEDKPEGMAPGARDLMTRILLGDKEKRTRRSCLPVNVNMNEVWLRPSLNINSKWQGRNLIEEPPRLNRRGLYSPPDEHSETLNRTKIKQLPKQ